MHEQPQSDSFLITLRNYARKLPYTIQRVSGQLHITPKFTYLYEELEYVYSKLILKKNLKKQKKGGIEVPFPQSLWARPELKKLESKEHSVHLGRESKKYRPLIASIQKKRTVIINHIIGQECHPLTKMKAWEREAFSRLGPKERQAFANYFTELLEALAPEGVYKLGVPPQTPHWPDEAEDVVFAAVNVFGYDAIRLNTEQEERLRQPFVRQRPDVIVHESDFDLSHESHLPFLDRLLLKSLDQLGRITGEVIRSWQKKAQSNNHNERHRAQRNLRQVGATLIPPVQGKQTTSLGIPDLEVRRRFYCELFRCQLAAALLEKIESLPRCSPWQQRLQAVCQVLNLPTDPKEWGVESARDVLLKLRDTKLRNTQKSAYFLTARQCGRDEKTIRNILSR